MPEYLAFALVGVFVSETFAAAFFPLEELLALGAGLLLLLRLFVAMLVAIRDYARPQVALSRNN
jgi:hypothetical protein